jgi:tight adherence protein B
VLAIDASLSMKGEPYTAAFAAARAFVSKRTPSEQIGLLAFNDRMNVAQRLTASDAALHSALSHPPALAYGTRIFDAMGRSLELLEHGRISAGSIVLLSDGADVGSASGLDSIVARAKRDRVRIFTVGLRSKTFEGAPLRRLAADTGGTYAEASSPAQLARIYGEISGRLASEYLLEYHSNVAPGTPVQVSVDIPGVGGGTVAYQAPTPSGLKPFHRSLITRFLLSPGSLALLSLLAAGLAGFAFLRVLRMPRRDVVGRIGSFVTTRAAASLAERPRRRASRAAGEPPNLLARRMGRLESDFEIGNISISPTTFFAVTVGLTIVAMIVLIAVAVPLVLLAVLVPVFALAWVASRVKSVRDDFADQLPETLQLLASALRSGHSFIGALSVVVENAPEPTQREFRQVVTDDQIGVPIDRALRRVATRMKNRDMRQVALLGELQRTAGGNAAEVLDTVVSTVRERAQIRRLAQTLTAQGRMARWILSVLPIVLAILMLLIVPDLMRPMFSSSGGQVALVVAALFVVAGSFWIKQIVEIEV